MSGGHFDYNQYRIEYIADEVEQLILTNNSEDSYRNYSPETIEEFKKGLYYLKMAKIYTQRIDWLVSGDDGEDSFHSRLKKEINELQA